MRLPSFSVAAPSPAAGTAASPSFLCPMMPDAASVTVCAALLIVELAASVTVWAALEMEDVRLANTPGATSGGGASPVVLVVPGTTAASPPVEELPPVTAFLMLPTSPPIPPAAGAGVGSGAPVGAGAGVGAASGCSSPPFPVTCGFSAQKSGGKTMVLGNTWQSNT